MTKTRSTRIGAACGALAVATASIASACIPGVAAAQSAPTANRVWAQCVLTSDAVTALKSSMTSTGLATDKKIAFVVIYSFEANDGQRLSGTTTPEGPHTGPVICRNTTDTPAVSIDQVLQTDNISTTNVLDVENAIILRYGTTNVEKRYCHSVDANTDCFRLR